MSESKQSLASRKRSASLDLTTEGPKKIIKVSGPFKMPDRAAMCESSNDADHHDVPLIDSSQCPADLSIAQVLSELKISRACALLDRALPMWIATTRHNFISVPYVHDFTELHAECHGSFVNTFRTALAARQVLARLSRERIKELETQLAQAKAHSRALSQLVREDQSEYDGLQRDFERLVSDVDRLQATRQEMDRGHYLSRNPDF